MTVTVLMPAASHGTPTWRVTHRWSGQAMMARARAQTRADMYGQARYTHRAMRMAVMRARAMGRSGRPVVSGPSTRGDGTAAGGGGTWRGEPLVSAIGGAPRGWAAEGEQTRCLSVGPGLRTWAQHGRFGDLPLRAHRTSCNPATGT